MTQAVGKVSERGLTLCRFRNFLNHLHEQHCHTVKRGSRGKKKKKKQNERGAVKGTDLWLNEDKEEEETLFGLERLSHHQNPQMGRISCYHSLLVHHRKQCRLHQTADTCSNRITTPSQWITVQSHLRACCSLGQLRWSISHSLHGC